MMILALDAQHLHSTKLRSSLGKLGLLLDQTSPQAIGPEAFLVVFGERGV
jgi:hypothetical protein